MVTRLAAAPTHLKIKKEKGAKLVLHKLALSTRPTWHLHSNKPRLIDEAINSVTRRVIRTVIGPYLGPGSKEIVLFPTDLVIS